MAFLVRVPDPPGGASLCERVCAPAVAREGGGPWGQGVMGLSGGMIQWVSGGGRQLPG